MPHTIVERVRVPTEVYFMVIEDVSGDHVWLWLQEDEQGAEFEVCITDDEPMDDYFERPLFKLNETMFIRLLDRALDAELDIDVRLEDRTINFPHFKRTQDDDVAAEAEVQPGQPVITAFASCGQRRTYLISEIEGVLELLPNLDPFPPGSRIA